MHSITLRYVTLRYVTLRYITLHYTTLHDSTLHYITLHYITLHYITLHYITLHYMCIHKEMAHLFIYEDWFICMFCCVLRGVFISPCICMKPGSKASVSCKSVCGPLGSCQDHGLSEPACVNICGPGQAQSDLCVPNKT